MKALRAILAFALALCGVAFPLWMMHHGINYQDEPYQMLNAAEYLATPLAPLSAWLGHVWSGWFGYNLLSFRLLSVICMLLSVAIPVLYLYRLTLRTDLAFAVFGATAIWLTLVPAKGYLYGWDALSTLSLVALMTVCLAYLHRPTLLKAAILGVLAGIAFLARTPNIVAAGVCVGLIVCAASGKRKLTHSLLFAGVFATMVIVCISFIYGNPKEYLDSLRDNVISGHGITYLFAGYERSFLPLVKFTVYATAIYLAVKHLPALASVLLLTVLLAVGSALPDYPLATTSNFLALGYLVVGLALLREKRAQTVVIALLALCSTAGSDLGFEKVITLQSIVLIIALLGPGHRAAMLRAGLVMLVLTVIVEMPAQRLKSFEDEGYGLTTEKVTGTPFAGIYTTPQRAREIALLDSVISDWHDRRGRVLVIGDCFRFAADLISGEGRPQKIRHTYLLDTPEIISYTRQRLSSSGEGDAPLMVIATRPFDWRQPDIYAETLFPTLTTYSSLRPPRFTIFTP